jgi:hypothetical protein
MPEYCTREWHAAPERTRCLDHENAHCLDHERRRHEMYMLKDEVWTLTELGHWDGVLCVECAERRLGRALTRDDYRECTTDDLRQRWGGERMMPESRR